MMLIVDITILFLISQLRGCQCVESYNYEGSSEDLTTSIKSFQDRFLQNGITDETIASISKMNEDHENNISRIIKILQIVTDQNSIENEILDAHFHTIGDKFKETMEFMRKFENNEVEKNRETLETFRKTVEKVIDGSLSEIFRIFNNNVAINRLKEVSSDDSKVVENICNMGMSYSQFLDTVLGSIKTACLQYLYTKNVLFNLFGLTGSEDFTLTRMFLYEDTNRNYELAVNNMKDIMASGPTDPWSCDPSVVH